MASSVIDNLVSQLDNDRILFLGAGASCCVGLPTCSKFFEKFLRLPPSLGSFPRVLKDKQIPPLRPLSTTDPDERTCLILTGLRALNIINKDENYDVEDLLELLKSWKKLYDAGTEDALTLHTLVARSPAERFGGEAFKQQLGDCQRQAATSGDIGRVLSETIDWLCRDVHLVWGGREGLGKDAWKKWSEIFLKARDRGKSFTIFTTNYDLVFESMREDRGFKGIAIHIDGVTPSDSSGRYHYFDINNYANAIVGASTGVMKVPYFKLHGSLDWVRQPDDRIRVIPGIEVPPQSHVGLRGLFPPYRAKSTAEMGEPFMTLYGLFRECLMRASRCTVIGFSFRDEPLNEIFMDCYKKNNALRFYILAPHPNQGSIAEFVQKLRDIEHSRVETDEVRFGESDRYVQKTSKALDLLR